MDYIRRAVRWACDWLGIALVKGKVIFLGLDNAGKTTLLHKLADGRMVVHAPTQRATMETLKIGWTELQCVDLGGHAEAREVWKDYYAAANAIVFLVDATDRSRFAEARAVLNGVLMDPVLDGVTVAVLANKVDQSGAAGEAEVREALGLQMTGVTEARALELFMGSVLTGFGVEPAFLWIQKYHVV